MNYSTMDIPYEFQEILWELEDALPAILGVLLIVGLVCMVFAILLYVLEAAGMHAIAKRRGINHPWLAWLPIGNSWILGSIADQYQYVARGQIKNKRKILLGLAIASVVLSVIQNRVSVQALTDLFSNNGPSAELGLNSLLGLAGTALSITTLVFECMALYDLYGSCCPNNKVLFLVLGIFFGFLKPFFIFFNRKKDDGMPPRRPQYTAPVQPEYNTPDQF